MKVCFVYLGPIKFRGRMFKQIKTLQDAGHECVVVHGRTEDEEPEYAAYSFPVTPIRVVQEKNKLQTIITQLQFNWRASKAVLESGADAVVCIALQSALSGALAKKRNPAIRYVFDSNELSLESYTGALKKKIWTAVQKFVLKQADVVMHAEQHRLDYFNQTYPNRAKSFLLENLPYYREGIATQGNKCNRFVYLGILTPNRYIEEMIRAFGTIGDRDISLDIIGFGSKEYEKSLHEICEQFSYKNVRILPPVAHDQIYETLRSYDAGIAFYRNINLNNYYCAPNKVYDYIQMGMPVLTNDFPGLIDIVHKNGVGVCVSAITDETIRNGVREIRKGNLSGNITEAIKRRCSWENQSDEYLRLFGE